MSAAPPQAGNGSRKAHPWLAPGSFKDLGAFFGPDFGSALAPSRPTAGSADHAESYPVLLRMVKHAYFHLHSGVI